MSDLGRKSYMAEKNTELLWQQFAEKNNLSPEQVEQFKEYYSLIIYSNELFNLTAITELPAALAYHFTDSLILGSFIDLSKTNSIADVGTGAGLPGLALKIGYPQLKVFLIEVSHKKVEFLRMVIEKLGLENIEVCDLDWRTFLRKTDYQIDLFCARASLQPEELVRMFQPSSPYKNSQLVYWASDFYELGPKEKLFFKKEEVYTVKNKKRKLVFFGN